MTSEVQASDTVLLVKPASFGFHAEAARSNAFANHMDDPNLLGRAIEEFERLARRLTDAGVEVLILDDTLELAKPDAIFPNNWVSFHADGTMVLYPMATKARRLEREPNRLRDLLSSSGFDVRRVIDLSFHERREHFLEGTGSLVLDRPRKRAYACISPRTDPVPIADFDDRLDYSTLLFDAHDRSGRAIYHTNVLMSLGTRFAVLCPEAVATEYQDILIGEIEATGRTVIPVDYDQLRQFACNLIELRNRAGQPLIALSSAALASFRPEQRRLLENLGNLIDASIPTIEAVGGGSVRCMIADIHLPPIERSVSPGS
jgi:hypothetical protein